MPQKKLLGNAISEDAANWGTPLDALATVDAALASLEELLDDYRDYLRVREHREWDKNSREALYVRRLGRKTPQTYELYREFVESTLLGPQSLVNNIFARHNGISTR